MATTVSGLVLSKALGAFLSEQIERVSNFRDQTIAQTVNGVDLSSAILANRIIQVVENLFAQFQDSLDKSVDSLSPAVQRTLIAVHALALDLKNKTIKDFRNPLSELNTFANTLLFANPFANKTPQISEVTGTLVVHSETSRTTCLQIIGNFPEIGSRKPVLELKNGNTSFSPEELQNAPLEPSDSSTSVCGDLALKVAAFAAVGIGNFLAFKEHPPKKEHLVLSTVGLGVLAVCIIGGGNQPIDTETDTAATRNASIEPKGAKTNELTFFIDSSKLVPPVGNKIGYTQALLKFPRGGGSLPGNTNVDVFDILIGTVPQSPGKIVLETTHESTSAHLEKRTQKTIAELHSSKNKDRRAPNKERTLIITADPGWSLDLTSIKIETPPEYQKKEDKWIPKGSYGSELFKASDQQVSYKVWTKQVGHGESGWAKFVLQCDAVRSVPKSQSSTRSEEIKLKWGDSVIQEVPKKFKVIFDSFDGGHTEFASTDLSSNRHITVMDLLDGRIEIKARELKEINLEDIS